MKKSLSLLFLLVIVFTATAHEYDTTIKKTPVYLSVTLGPSFNNLSGSKIDHTQYWNNQAGIGDVSWSDATGIVINLNIQKQISKFFFLKTGVGYIQKQGIVDNTIWIRKDHLKTGYLFVPLIIGTNILPDARPLSVWVELGPSVNFAIVKKSFNEEAGMNTNAVTASMNLGIGMKYAVARNVRLMISYNYVHDLTSANTQTLYFSSYDPNKEYNYKFRSHLVIVGLQCPITR